jgi:hypothetical protein
MLWQKISATWPRSWGVNFAAPDEPTDRANERPGRLRGIRGLPLNARHVASLTRAASCLTLAHNRSGCESLCELLRIDAYAFCERRVFVRCRSGIMIFSSKLVLSGANRACTSGILL